ncbi:MAG TPA: thioesterase family protein, partial [Beijerinckiaceae bacterium]|nr:thioesterase family protein [Beijerinckiaceae bacterium]
ERLEPPFGVSRLPFRVLPNDLDTNLHLNNGRYLTIADLGRTDLLLRSRLWRAVIEKGWMPMLSGGIVRFRRELRPFEAFTLETRVVYWNERNMVMEHRFITRRRGKGPDQVAAIVLVRGGLYDRTQGRFIDCAEIFRFAGYEGPSPEVTPEVAAFMAAEDQLKRMAVG